MFRVAMVGCGRMAGTIDDEVVGYPASVLPYSHAAAYQIHPETDIVAAADINPEALDRFCERYGVENRYDDYEEMVLAQKPDIVSVTTHAVNHAAPAVLASDNGVKGIYCEKSMAAALAEADAMVDACDRNGTKLIVGASRRWYSGFDKCKEIMASGEIGDLVSLVSHAVGTLLHTHSHTFDLMMWLADSEPEWVQGWLWPGDYDPTADAVTADPAGGGRIHMKNGVDAYVIGQSGQATHYEHEMVCSQGTLRALNNNSDFEMRKPEQVGRWSFLRAEPFPAFERRSSTLTAVEDLVNAIKTGQPTRNDARTGRWAMEIAFGLLESHNANGARVALPLERRDRKILSR